MVEQLNDFKQELKKFINSKQTAEDYVKLLTTYEAARNKNVKLSNIITTLEELTKTKIDDEFTQS